MLFGVPVGLQRKRGSALEIGLSRLEPNQVIRSGRSQTHTSRRVRRQKQQRAPKTPKEASGFSRDLFGMGSRVAVSVGIVLLIAGAQAWASAQDRFGARSNETLNQTRAAGPRPRAQLSHRLRIYQVQRPGAEKERERRPPKDLQVAENAGGGPERPGTGDPVPTLVLMPGPVLNPPLELRTRVRLKNTVSLTFSVLSSFRLPVIKCKRSHR